MGAEDEIGKKNDEVKCLQRSGTGRMSELGVTVFRVMANRSSTQTGWYRITVHCFVRVQVNVPFRAWVRLRMVKWARRKRQHYRFDEDLRSLPRWRGRTSGKPGYGESVDSWAILSSPQHQLEYAVSRLHDGVTHVLSGHDDRDGDYPSVAQ